jgi:hypothetical protein
MKQIGRLVLVLTLATLSATTLCLPAVADDQPAGKEHYSVFYSPPARVDALFDAVMDAMPAQNLAEAKALWPENESGNPEYHWVRPDEESVAAMEEEFGDMPEYWQLRYGTSGGYSFERLWMLERAVEVAPDDPLSLYCLGNEGYTAAGRRHNTGLDEWRVSEEEVAALQHNAVEHICRAAKLGCEDAFYSYEAAFYLHLDGGELEQVLALLRQGNEAPVNEWVAMFPAGYINREMSAIRQRYSKNDRYALALPWYICIALPRFTERIDMVKDLAQAAADAGDTDTLNMLHRFAYRYASEGQCTSVQAIVGIAMGSAVARRGQEMSAGNGDPATVRGFIRLNRLGGMVWGRSNGAHFGWEWRAASELGLDADQRKDILHQPFWDNAARLWDYMLMEQEMYRVRCQPCFDDLMEFDFSDPAAFAPPEGGK